MAWRALLVLALALAVGAPAAVAAPHPGYRIPADNPYVATPGARAEVYVRGMRNPYRWSFDRPTGDMYIADVGGNQREEIDYLPSAKIAGANLGWHCFEGNLRQKVCKPPNYFPPAFEYQSSPDVVIGGYVVHDPDLPSFQGRYLYGQYGTGVWALGPHAISPSINLSAGIAGVTSFGEDGAGHLYATSYDGPLYRLGESAGALTLTQIGDFARPTQVLSPPGDTSELFVVEKAGRVRLLSGGVVSDFLDIRDKVQDDGYEEGLLGFVAAPDYASSGRVFAFYSDNGGDIQVDEYRRTATGPDRADPNTREPIITIQHDQGDLHHGGQMNFGSDGYLYLSTGDGDVRVDAQNDAQRLDSLLGKILRIDVRAGKVDKAAPKLLVTLADRQRVLSNKAAVAYASCSERCSVIGSARLRLGHGYDLVPAGIAQRAGRRGRIALRLTPSCVRALERARKRKREVSVRLTLRAQDLTGNSPRAVTRTIRVSG
jgi:glucose/arabinose dehydrogenase